VPHELQARLHSASEDAKHVTRDRHRVLLLNAAQYHAQVLRLNDHRNPLGVELFLQSLGDLGSQPLLHLEPASIQVHQPRNFAKSDNPLARDVGHMAFPEEGKEVMLAEAV